ncbi:D-proline reductase (dithiol) proprotein PrdA [Enterococcus hirae]|nr:D-proline reductase (dithiol) proprotein PrdA [Enterococcus hirae]
MSITAETAQEHAKDLAVLCCRAEAGTVITPENLEDPAIFLDLEESGLLEFSEDVLTIEQVLGTTLKETTDALIPLTKELLEGVSEGMKEVHLNEKKEVETSETIATPTQTASSSVTSGQTIKIHIAEGKGIDLELPLMMATQLTETVNPEPESIIPEQVTPVIPAPVLENSNQVKEKVIRSVRHDHLKIDQVIFGEETKIEGTTLILRKMTEICAEAVELEQLVEDMTLEIITPDKYTEYSETIMDVQPIAAKVEGDLGHGITRVLDGVVMVVTGTDANGVQIGEFGSSEGELDRNIMWGRPGAPDKGEIFIKTQVTIKEHANMERPGPLAAHKASDYITQEIREALKKADESLVIHSEEIIQKRRIGNKKVLIIKEIMGQGAMHDNLIMSIEPVGTFGAKPNVDLGNLPILLAPTEVLDGGIHALTCIGPASKETSRHYWREPLVKEAMADEEIDLVGVMFIGSPQANTEKYYVSKRLGMTVEAMDIDGAIVTTEGFGNNHIDFASHMEEIGKRGIKVVGDSYSAVQGALVVGNSEMGAMVDNNKSKQGIENEILSNNTLCREDAIRDLAMLKTLMGGGTIKPAERKWNPNVKQNNIEIIEKTTGRKIDLEENEQSLPKSKKRQEIYEKE